MSDEETEFRPKLGRIRSRGTSKRFVNRVLIAAELSGFSYNRLLRIGTRQARPAKRFGRGRVAAFRATDRLMADRSRRVVIKARVVRLGKGIGAARAHLSYLQRDGVTRDGARGQLYGADREAIDGKGFIERSVGDRHQFRFIVAPEDAADMSDLKGFTRDLMAQMERDLGTWLDWAAVDHFNTDNPHTHIVLRGADAAGRDLVISPDYISHGMRARASELMTLELGPKSEQEIRARLGGEVGQDRYTSLDAAIARQTKEGVIDLRPPPGAGGADSQDRGFARGLMVGRMQKLERMGLADALGPAQWRIAPNARETLRALGERGDIIKTLHRAMNRSPSDYAIHEGGGETIVGRVVEKGLADEQTDRPYLIVDGIDGRAHYLRLTSMAEVEDLPTGAVVEVGPEKLESRRSDQTIARLAAENDGIYSPSRHLAEARDAALDARIPGAFDAEAYVEAHVRRLEALRRAGIVERLDADRWQVPPDYAERSVGFDARKGAGRAVGITMLSFADLDSQVTADGATWLDRQLVGYVRPTLAAAGFGQQVREALDHRAAQLVDQGLATRAGARLLFARDLLATLQERELTRVGNEIAVREQVPYRPARNGDPVRGTYRRSVTLASGRFALIENAREFTLVPWRPVLERELGREVTGVMRGSTVSWSLGRQRGRGIG
jgi:type IV secretory pathway VirD2 relaxase